MNELTFLANNSFIRTLTAIALLAIAALVISHRRTAKARRWNVEKVVLSGIGIIAVVALVSYAMIEGERNRIDNVLATAEQHEQQRARQLRDVQYSEQMQSAAVRQRLYFNPGIDNRYSTSATK